VSLGYAGKYLRIILYGMPFSMLSFGFSHCTRAQGFPLMTMSSMCLGAGLNMVLDPLFIFVFHWGVEGAAWATIISQMVSACWILSFNLSPKAVIRLRLKTFKPSMKVVLQIMAFGSAPSLLQFAMSAVQLLYNTSMGWYGAESLGVANGGDIALSGMNICGSLVMLVMMPVFGINQGAQPILGYNYGAKKYRRVLRAYLGAVGAATAICTAGFLIVQISPITLVKFFAPRGSPALFEFTPYVMRVALLLLPLNGFQIVSSNMFVVTGRPKISIFLSLLRQALILVPCMYIFGKIWALWGVVAAAPVADAGALILTGTMVSFELKKLRTGAREASS